MGRERREGRRGVEERRGEREEGGERERREESGSEGRAAYASHEDCCRGEVRVISTLTLRHTPRELSPEYKPTG